MQANDSLTVPLASSALDKLHGIVGLSFFEACMNA